MVRKVVFLVALVVMTTAAPVFAQSPRVELSGLFGWTFSDGVTGDAVVGGDGNVYNQIDPTDSFSWGFSLGVLTNENVEVGFLYGQQRSTLEISGTTTREIGDFDVNTYHGYFAYNFGEADSPVRPYVLGGFGATSYGSVSFTAGGVARETGGETQYSSTWGAGVKVFPAPRPVCGSACAGRQPTSSPTPLAGGAIRSGAATSSRTRSTRINSRCRGA